MAAFNSSNGTAKTSTMDRVINWMITPNQEGITPMECIDVVVLFILSYLFLVTIITN